jgi:hypothetical protein
MKRITGTLAAMVCIALASAVGVQADVKTEQKSQVKFEGALGRVFNMFGGKAAKEGLVTKTAIKGDRKLTVTGDTGQLVDLAEEKVYDIDFKRQSYEVTTFEELRRRMREAQEKAREQQAKAAKEKKSDEQMPEYEIEVSNKATGESKTINGFDTKQVVTTVLVRQKGRSLEEGGGMVLTSDSWLAPKIAAMQDVVDFEMRYWKKLEAPMGGMSAEQMAAALAMYPMLGDALSRVKTEGAQVDGTAIHTTMTVEGVKSPEQVQQEAKSEESAGGGGLGGMLARRMMRKKKDDSAGTDGANKNRAAIMTMYSEVLNVSPEVAAADVQVPAGFKERN